MPLVTSSVSFEQLKELAERNDRVGATEDIQRRKGEYERDGYRGTMYYFKTPNMKSAENTLLSVCKACGACPRNVQRVSNAQASPGYVYVIAN